MKKLISILLVLVLMLGLLTGCSGNTIQKREPKLGVLGLKESELYVNSADYAIGEHLEEAGVKIKEVDDASVNEYINQLARELVDFANAEYGLEWEYADITTYTMDVSKSSNYYYYNAIADPAYGRFYFNEIFGGNMDADDVKYVAAHELVHLIRYHNIGRYEFGPTDDQGYGLGFYTGEAFTDLFVVKFFAAKGDEQAKRYFNVSSAYCYTNCALAMLEYPIPNLMMYYLTDDYDGFATDFNAVADMCIESSEEHISEAQAFLYRADVDKKVVDKYAAGKATIHDLLLREECVYGNFERAAMMAQGCSAEERKEVYQLCCDLFEDEGTAPMLQEYLKYFKDCMD